MQSAAPQDGAGGLKHMTANALRVKMHDKHGPLVSIGKHLGMFVDQVQVRARYAIATSQCRPRSGKSSTSRKAWLPLSWPSEANSSLKHRDLQPRLAASGSGAKQRSCCNLTVRFHAVPTALATCPLLALLPPQQSRLGLHRARLSCKCLTANFGALLLSRDEFGGENGRT